jgi:hypothetical protein
LKDLNALLSKQRSCNQGEVVLRKMENVVGNQDEFESKSMNSSGATTKKFQTCNNNMLSRKCQQICQILN